MDAAWSFNEALGVAEQSQLFTAVPAARVAADAQAPKHAGKEEAWSARRYHQEQRGVLQRLRPERVRVRQWEKQTDNYEYN